MTSELSVCPVEAAGYPHEFDGPLRRFGVGRNRQIYYTVLFIPPELKAALPFATYPRLRVEGEIADLPVEGAWMPAGDGRHYSIVAARVLRAVNGKVGTVLGMRFRIADQNAVDVPPELAAALMEDAQAYALWEALTPGRRRGLTHRIHSAKSADTRKRRTADVIALLKGG